MGKFIYFLVSIGAGVIMAASFSLGLFSGWENFFEDLLFSPKPVDPEIVILAIDSDSINRLGQWPWPREIFAQGFSKLDEARPKAVGFDVMLSETSRLGEKDDLALKAAIEGVSYPVVFPVEATPLFLTQPLPQAPNLLKPLSIFTANQNIHLGHVNLILDKDGVARRFPLRIETQGEVSQEFRAFSYEVIKQSRRDIPAEADLETVPRIVFASPADSIKRIPFWRLMEEDLRGQFKDKIVFVGATAPDLHDEQLTPFEKGTAMPGVEIQANIANMLVSGYRLVPLSRFLSLFWIFLAAILPALVFVIFSRSLKPIFINLVLGVIYLILIIVLFEKGIAANILHVNFSWFLGTGSLFGYRYFAGEKERREMKNLFSKYVSKDVLEEILKDPSRVALGGEEKEITVFFSDIRGFTTLSEKTTPQELVRILNRYFTLMSEEILKNGGVLDKYIGDAIMAFWGAPIEDINQADNALKASLGMIKKLEQFNEELRESHEPEINIGIGIYTGPAVVGNIGSEQRFDYTIIGDTVNVASRLEGLNKQYGTNIIIGESTKNQCRGDYRFQALGSVEVKGRKEPLTIYTLNIGKVDG